MSIGKLFVISGPSGVGKGTIVKEVMNSAKDIKLSVSATTRSPREGEIEGISYFFLTEDEFKSKVEDNGFLEYASVHGNFYGTPKEPVLAALEAGVDVILEIDVQGAMQVKKSYEGGIYIFVLPPSLKELTSRIRSRGTESSSDIELRMGKALDEMRYLDQYDYYVMNDSLEDAISDTISIMSAEHHRVCDNTKKLIWKFEEENK